MNIDFNYYFLPVNFPDLLRDIAHGDSPQVRSGPLGSQHIAIIDYFLAPHRIEFYDLDEKRLAMDRTEIDMQGLPVPPYTEAFPRLNLSCPRWRHVPSAAWTHLPRGARNRSYVAPRLTSRWIWPSTSVTIAHAFGANAALSGGDGRL